MGADHDVHQALLEIRDGLLDLPRGAEAAHELYADGIVLHALDKGSVVLLGQDGGRDKVHHLLALLDGLEGRPDGDFRLAVAHVPADEAVHDFAALHVGLCVRDGRQLILRLLKREHLLELPLPDGILFIGMTLAALAQGVELHQIRGHLAHRAADLGLGALPFLGAQLVELRLLGIGGGVFLNHVQARGQHVEVAAVPVLYLDVVLDHALHLHLLDALVDT